MYSTPSYRRAFSIPEELCERSPEPTFSPNFDTLLTHGMKCDGVKLYKYIFPFRDFYL